MRSCFRLSLALGLLLTAFAHAAPPSLPQLLGSPFPTSLVAAPHGGKLAWVFNDRGRRNIWTADAPDYKPRPLTAFTADDGQEITDLAWAADGLCYVRGNGSHGGETLNPRSTPKVADRTVWYLPTPRGEPRRLGPGHAPAVSPKGDRVAFLHRGQVWLASLRDDRPAEQAFQTRGQVRQLRWSPDGTALAFVSDRGDHRFVGVFRDANTSLRWLDPSVDRDGDPAWSPDGRQIAFLRLPTSRTFEFSFGPQPTAQPWSIRVADVADGKGRQVWQARPGVGSAFRSIDAPNQLLWGSDDRLVFPWEADGWTHLYSVPVRGGPANLLTPGKFEVEAARLSPDRTGVFFSSNQDDADRRHLWSVPIAPQSKPSPLTSGTGIEWAPVPTADGKAIAFLRSDARRPAHPALLIDGAVRDLVPVKSDFPAAVLVEPKAVSVTAADGRQAPAQL